MIKKFIFLTVFAISFTSLHASHVLGGEITWVCQGSSSYIFTLKLYRDCAGPALSTNSVNIQWQGGTISLPHDTSYTINEQCFDPSQSFSCADSMGGSVEAHVFKSAPVSLPGSPPPSGWEFSYNSCCRSYSSINTSTSTSYYIRSRMYPHSSGHCSSSPSFISDPNPVLSYSEHNFSSMATLPEDGDSLYYRFVSPLQGASQPMSFTSGYSANAPFPDSSEDTANGSVQLDPTSGLISTDIANGPVGVYYYGIQVECWRDYQLISTVTREVGAWALNPTATNTVPSLDVDTSAYPSVSIDAQGRMTVIAYVGDSVNFDMSGFDPDLNGWFPTVVTFKAKGHSLGANWPGGGNNGYVHQPSITPVNGGFSGSQSKSVHFRWLLDAEHSHSPRTSHLFNLSFQDDHCPNIAISNRTLEVIVVNPAAVELDTINICEGDSVQLTNNFTLSQNYAWSPNIEISDTSVAEPFVSATSSRYYYLTDPDNPGFIDSVFVQVEPSGTFALDYNNGQLSLTDSVNAGVKTWYYNGIPFQPQHDTLSPFGPGEYCAGLVTENCKYFSDTINVLPGSYSIADPSHGNLAGEVLELTGTLGTSFELDSSASGNLQQILIPGIGELQDATSGLDISIKLYDDQSNMIWSKDTTVGSIIDGVFRAYLHHTLLSNKEYTLTVSGDSGYAFHYFDRAKAPFHPWNNGLMVTGIFEDSSKAFPTQVSERMLPIILQIEQTIGVEEMPFSNVRIYPNPAQDQFFVEGLEKDSKLQLLDMQGKLVREIDVDAEVISISRNNLSSGVYFLKLEAGKTANMQKIIFR